jgi:penicillin-binding protein 1A
MSPLSKKWNIALSILFFVSVFFICLFVYTNSLLEGVRKSLPSVEKISTHQASLPSIVLSADGEKIGEFFSERRYLVSLKSTNKHLVDAFLSAEDSRFYEHNGIDTIGILRAGFSYLTLSKSKQGGSTITQQLAKTLLLSREKTLTRKLKDILLAKEIEKKFSKEKILELYLNTIFLGNNSYGIEAASRNFFKKSNNELNIAESALIAGLTPAPSAYSPTDNMIKAKVRQRFVLEQMLKNKKISKEEFDAALNHKIVVFRAESPNVKVAPFFLIEVKKKLEDKAKITDL